MAYRTGLTITDGTEQEGRFPVPLREGYFRADEMSFEHLLALSAEFASTLSFYNLNNEKDGSWAELFANDETVVMAQILSMDLKKVEAEFLNYLQRSANGLNPALYLCRLAQTVDIWFKRLNTTEQTPKRTLSLRIAAMVENRLAADLHGVGARIERLERTGPELVAGFRQFDRIWGFGKGKGESLFPKSGFLEQPERASTSKQFIRSAFYSFVGALSYLQKITRDLLDETLRSGRHNPAIGLFMSFLLLMRNAQEKLNTFTQSHLDFYYSRFLRCVPRGSVPDSAHLVCEAVGSAGAFIRKGSLFPAGKDEYGEEILYRADNDLAVIDARVASLCTLYFERDPLISPERELGYVTRVRAGKPSKVRPGGNPADAAWPVFGAAKKESGRIPAEETDIGFAVSSPLLLLKEGRREIDITIAIYGGDEEDAAVSGALEEIRRSGLEEDAFFRAFGVIFRHYLFSSRELLSSENKQEIMEKARILASEDSSRLIRNLLEQDRQDLFYSVLSGSFSVSLTVEAGWHDLPHAFISRPADSDREAQSGFRFAFTLGPEAPAVVPHDPAIHGGRYETGLPLARFRVNPRANVCPYSLLQGLNVRDIIIETAVKGVTELVACNNHGQLDPSKPFNPFGPAPTRNSYFIIGNHELSKKTLTSLDVNVEWGDLPTVSGGFQRYYKGYDTEFSTKAFEVEVSVLRDGRWQPDKRETGSVIKLFGDETKGERIARKKSLGVNVLRYFKPSDQSVAENEFRFDLKARNGFVRFTLAGPETAFGHGEYPLLLTRVLTENARVKKTKLAEPLPNPPYTPLINVISFDYTARSVISLETGDSRETNPLGEKIFHLHPFGIEAVYPSRERERHCLVPRYSGDGNLFIGISADRLKGLLTLYFNMREDSTLGIASMRPMLSWSCLSSNHWQRLEEARVVADTTSGFLSSGIVTLDVPADANQENSVMPNGLFWLSVSADRELDSFCSLYSVQLNALKVTRRFGSGPSSHTVKPLPAGIINGPAISVPGLGAVRQPAATFGGRPEENRTQMVNRISERLRHKNRAVLPWDYERLIMERFPSVFKAKCFAAMSSSTGWAPRPGHALVVVVPYGKERGGELNLNPMMNAVELSRISAFINELGSPFARVEVRNPAYERVQVRCTIKLTRQAEARRGFYVNALNRAIMDFISPWSNLGYKAAFGWCIRREDIESYILGLEYVELVTGFSMLHITEDEQGLYSLTDTARPETGLDREHMAGESSLNKPGWCDQIGPKYPWSLAIPAGNHFIETIDAIRFLEAEATGVNELEVGHTFIIDA